MPGAADIDTLPAAARRLVRRHDLVPHPEGGWYRRVVTSAAEVATERGPRPAMTSILFLLSGAPGRPHRVSSDEVWHHLDGDDLVLAQLVDGQLDERVLGAGGEPLAQVAAGRWQAARCPGRYALAGCTVAPGFDFNDFELADDGQLATLLEQAPAFAAYLR